MLIEYSGFPVSIWLEKGLYRIECWGASGGSRTGDGGRGSYVSGKLSLNAKTLLYIYVGEGGRVNDENVIFNGGGKVLYTGYWSTSPSSYGSSGGGATDIRLIGGDWDDFDSLKSRIIVAGGGGGETLYNASNGKIAPGGSGGFIGFPGSSSICCSSPGSYSDALGGNQEFGGLGGTGGASGGFGYGGISSVYPYPISGGGSGYFGGGGGGVVLHVLGSGAGGSSFVSGHSGCSAISENYTTGSPIFNGSIHYSGIRFFDNIIKNGTDLFESPNNILENGHLGNGSIRITSLLPSSYSSSLYHQLSMKFLLISFFLS